MGYTLMVVSGLMSSVIGVAVCTHVYILCGHTYNGAGAS